MLQLLRARNNNLILRSGDDEATTKGKATQQQQQARGYNFGVHLVMPPNLIFIRPSVNGHKGRERQSTYVCANPVFQYLVFREASLILATSASELDQAGCSPSDVLLAP
jgi:hypothetical protein